MTLLSFEASDGWPLEGDLISEEAPKCAVLVSAGTAFPRKFYHAFAAYLASKGAAVLIYDYRGIGGSEGPPERFRDIDYTDYAMDQDGAVQALSAAFPDLPIAHVAHSVGGHYWGLVPSHRQITRHAQICVGTGYWGVHQPSNWLNTLMFWWVIGSINLMRFGELRPWLGWKGTRLPPKVFRTWRRWACRKAYFSSEIPKWNAHYEDVTAPMRSWVFSDDPIATERSNADLMSVYPNAPKEVLLRTPADYGLKRIGHEGAFRKGREALWEEIWDWVSLG